MSAFHCRAYLLLQKELFKLKRFDLWGIDVELLDDNIFYWKATLSGLKDTSWQGGKFVVLLKFTEMFNSVPPEVCFQSIPLHPNIDNETGNVCLDCLEQWNPDVTVSHILLSLQNLLSEPSLNSPINEVAAKMARESPKRYEEVILDCVMSSNHEESRCSLLSRPFTSESGADPDKLAENTEDDKLQEANYKGYKKSQSVCKLSYQDYLNLWKAMGTTKSSSESKNPFIDLLSENFDQTQYDALTADISSEIYRQLSEHRLLMYGQFKEDKIERNKMEQLNANKIQLLKDIHSNRRGMKSLRVSLPVSPTDDENEELHLDFDPIEVKDLISWTENLPDDV